jgi:Fe-S-cluster-containing hydrogenase component 2/CRP-like cAMP-binding protein
MVVGEMSCLSGTPRTADVAAVDAGEVWEVRRNVLDRIMRSPTQRRKFEDKYRGAALDTVLRNAEVFEGLPAAEYDACVEFLRPRLAFVRANPGQPIFKQGDWADAFYMVRLGHIRVGIRQNNREASVLFRGPGTAIGEIGLLALSPEDAGKKVEEVDAALAAALQAAVDDGAAAGKPTNFGAAIPSGRRTADCSALDHLELARVNRADFLEMLHKFPHLRRKLVEISLQRLGGDGANVPPVVREYVEQGLYQGQSLLVLDLEKCTRCDECTKACVDQHGTESHGLEITRLLREGLRFGNSLVATSCRSCKDAYCMIGCPVDSIHRGKHLQIVIEDHCIGCGLCANNCPYGNIWMVPNHKPMPGSRGENAQGGSDRQARIKAAACDLCDAKGELEVPQPRCVYACPHDAAHRMTGEQLLKRVMGEG